MTVLVIGQNYWGHSDTLDKAKAQFELGGGTLSKGYMIVKFTPEQKFTGVDMLGQVHWTYPEGGDAELKQTHVQPRKSSNKR